jgi:predicted RNA binding protein YcfA (HicA-like mRNA interferase family)
VALQTASRSRALDHAIVVASRRITPISHRKLVKVFELEGFAVIRQKGDHLILTRPGAKRPVVIKTSPKEIPVTHILTNLQTAGISRERYFELLSQL